MTAISAFVTSPWKEKKECEAKKEKKKKRMEKREGEKEEDIGSCLKTTSRRLKGQILGP